MSAMMNKLLEAIKLVLKDVAALTDSIPAENMRPAEDPIEPSSGGVLYYSFTGGLYDRKAKRATATVTIAVGSVDNNKRADELMDLVRDSLTPKAMTATGKVTVHRFSEVEGFTDEGTTGSDRFISQASFDAKFVEA